MKKITIYINGTRAISDETSGARLHQGVIQEEIDLSNTSDDEFKKLLHNPHDDQLLQEIKNKGKIK